jgi:hypothetical protein
VRFRVLVGVLVILGTRVSVVVGVQATMGVWAVMRMRVCTPAVPMTQAAKSLVVGVMHL